MRGGRSLLFAPYRGLENDMRKLLLGAGLGVLGLGAVAGLAIAAQGDGMMRPNFMRMMEDRAALLDARLAGLKAALKLTPDQEKLWAPFETSVRDAAKTRDDAMKAMRDARAAGQPRPSPVDRLDMMATRMEEGAKALHGIAASAKPLYAALDTTQQERFDFLGRMMLDHGRGGRGGDHGRGGRGMMDGDQPAPPAPNAQ
jgi:hypothetical protein